MRFNIKNQRTISFKKRYSIGYKLPTLQFGDFSFVLAKSYNIEYIYLYNFKKSLKKYYGFKKSTDRKVWLFLHQNYPLTKKSKNSRMGKGKGAFSRYCSRVVQNHTLFEFIGFNLSNLTRLKKILKKKFNVPVFLKSNFFINTSYRAEKNFFFKKYLM